MLFITRFATADKRGKQFAMLPCRLLKAAVVTIDCPEVKHENR